ncbi:tripartite tricarboxylate transporter permease [Archaeoglobus veneficus]|uniref:tripartite tricarboxylate transporter permease n=1 Tax=Archaeoglobus veneficus TaxID=58290 RepID=UPI00064F34E7|nr:tripartite tricarboxylate transporter permease [Archaeoglobus veneficus]
MFVEFVAGLLIGLITGLTPGIHVNTAVAVLLLLKDSLPFPAHGLATVVVTAAIAHTFLDIVPAIFTGIPEEDTAIAIFPTHEMVLEGRGVEAASISAFSSLFSILLSLPLFFTILLALPAFVSSVSCLTPFVLLAVSALTIMGEKGEAFEGSLSAWRKRFYALLVFASSGFLGYVALDNSGLAELTPASSVLLPLLSGLFASPALLSSVASGVRIPRQVTAASLPEVRAVASGVVSGFAVSLFRA